MRALFFRVGPLRPVPIQALYGEHQWNPKSAPAAASPSHQTHGSKTKLTAHHLPARLTGANVGGKHVHAQTEVYLDNKSRAQRAWLDRNPDYWRAYRANGVDARKKQPIDSKTAPAPLSGLYRIQFIPNIDPAKSDEWIAEISPVCADCPCKKNECKDITRSTN